MLLQYNCTHHHHHQESVLPFPWSWLRWLNWIGQLLGWDFRDCLRGQEDKTFKGPSVPNSFKCFGKSHPGILHACFVVSHCPVNQSSSPAFGVTGSDDLWSRERSLILVVVRAPSEERWLVCTLKRQFSIHYPSYSVVSCSRHYWAVQNVSQDYYIGTALPLLEITEVSLDLLLKKTNYKTILKK